jgi:hypothetical protein
MEVRGSHAPVGRPGFDPGTLRVFPEWPGTSISVQICWPDEAQRPPTSTGVLSRLTSWLDSWLDQGSSRGQVTIRIRELTAICLSCDSGTSRQFATSPFCRIIGTLDVRNVASRAVVAKLGFSHEAQFIQNSFFKGKWISPHVFAVLREEWDQ